MRRRSSMRRSTSRLRRAGLSVRGARAGTTKSSSSREEEITNLLALNASVVAGERHPSEKVAYCQKATTVSFLRQRKLRSQIGRASCRERVCQYVLISVVAVSLKKKTKIV